MEDLEGKVICNKFMDCGGKDGDCDHRIPHTMNVHCHLPCEHNGGNCVPIKVYCRSGGECVYAIQIPDGSYHTIDQDRSQMMPEFYMDQMIYICPSHDRCFYDECRHKQFHNKLAGCESICSRHNRPDNAGGVACREANADEILQLFIDHLGENQHIDDMLQQDDNVYSDLIDELSKPKPEIPKPVHERVKRFLNLEL